MCGIVGYIGKNQAVPFLMEGLKKLEYRGYDSSGIAILNNNKINIIKKKGKLNFLNDILNNNNLNLNSFVGIGHTRWATHGGPSDVNSHPHISDSGKIAIVHNGIIENYINLKKFLISKNKTFVSDTDTEVIAQLIDYLYNGDIFESVKKAIKQLEGSYSLGILCKDNPDQIIAVKKDSPLIIGIGEDENYIASDIPAVLSKTNKIYRLGENEIAIIKNNSINIYNSNGDVINKSVTIIDWSIDSAQKNNYDHFMIKEIMEQPEVINKTLFYYLKNNNIIFENINFSKEYLNKLSKIFIVACGSAYHVGCTAKYIIEDLTKKSVEVDLASEFRYRNPIIDSSVLVIIISQSGETADSLAALREAKKLGAKILSIVNVVGSSISNESDYVLYTKAGPEIAVATTKAFSAQLIIIYLFSLYISKILDSISEKQYFDYIKNILLIPKQINNILNNKNNIKLLAKKYFNINNAFFIGRNIDYSICMEGSLKLKEISYIHSEAYAAGELKHGTISLIEQDTLVLAVATQDLLFDKTISNIREVKARGAKILAITTEDKKEKISQISDSVFYIPKTNNLLTASLSIIPLQLFSYYAALFKDCDIDKPRNLAKSVTVE